MEKMMISLMMIMMVLSVNANHQNRERIARSLMSSVDTSSSVRASPAASYFNQTLDHFAVDSVSFQQKYYINDEFWTNRSTGPVFLSLGGEGPLSSGYVTSGEFTALAQAHGALAVALEHRFYGESQPFSYWNTTSLAYLTTSQALEDIAFFQSEMIKAYNLSSTNKWVIFGCSYSGALSAWYKLKYPHLTIVAMSTSSPVEATLDFYQYDQFCGQALGNTCMKLIQNATASIEKLLIANATAVLEKFNCQEITDPVAFLYVIADVIAFVVQYNTNYHMLDPVCAAFENSTEAQLVDTYADVTKMIFSSTGNQCGGWDITSFTDETANDNDNMRQWMWQSCLELGYFQTAPANNSLRSTLITADWHLKNVCAKLFNIPNFTPQIDWTNHVYGGQALQVENVVFTNGDIDPWRFLSVTKSLSPSVPSIIIANGSHCPNWGTPNATTDPAPVTVAHQLIASYFNGFLTGCTDNCNQNGNCLPHTTSDVDVVMSCRCYSGYSGDSCSSDDSSSGEQPEAKKTVPWWAVLVAAIGVLVIAVPIGFFIGRRNARSHYDSV